MAASPESDARAQLARWFIDHDEVEEAAATLEPGDELTLGRSDYLDLAAALSRRGLSARYEQRLVSVVPQATGDALAAGPRRPPARMGSTLGNQASAKKTA
jgi:hypothetical protein